MQQFENSYIISFEIGIREKKRNIHNHNCIKNNGIIKMVINIHTKYVIRNFNDDFKKITPHDIYLLTHLHLYKIICPKTMIQQQQQQQPKKVNHKITKD